MVMPRVFGFNLFYRLYIGLWKAAYYKSFMPKLGGMNHYSCCKLGVHFKGHLFEMIWTK